MVIEDVRLAAEALLKEIAARPEDRKVLQEQLRAKIREMHALGLPVPADLAQFDEEQPDDTADDFFDNMPV